MFGSLFLCPCECVGASCWERRLPAGVCHRNRCYRCCYYCPLLTHIYTYTYTYTHARTTQRRQSYTCMRANYAHTRTKIIVPTTYLFGSPFLCPCEYVSVSCWDRRLPARVCHRNRGYRYYCPLSNAHTHIHAHTRTHAHA